MTAAPLDATSPGTNRQKVMYPAAGFTKGQVIDYYQAIAPALLPHLKDRPLTLKRYPNGVDQSFFYEKNCPVHRPDWIQTADVKGKTGKVSHCTVSDLRGLLWVANLASLELHVLLSRSADINRPTQMVFDLDPGAPATVADCARVALRLRSVLDHAGLQCFPKTSGGKGLHIYVPLNSPVTFDQTKPFAEAIAGLMEREDPARITARMSKAGRAAKIFIDWSQNDRHKTTACVYSLRARERPTVSTPVTWDEVEAAMASRRKAPLVFETKDVLKRVESQGDLFAPILKIKQRLPNL